MNHAVVEGGGQLGVAKPWVLVAAAVGIIAVALGGPGGWSPAHPAAQRTAYTVGTAQFRKGPGAAVVGTVTPGTPVSVTETRGANAHVIIVGYSSAGSSAVGVRIVLVNLSAPDQADRQVGAQTKESYGTAWAQVTVRGWVPANALASDVQTVWTHGKQLYEAHLIRVTRSARRTSTRRTGGWAPSKAWSVRPG